LAGHKKPGKEFQKLEKRLSYVFRDFNYLEQALTHRSKKSNNNERLEFLGDAVLGFVIASDLYQQFPDAKEGQLSRCRASLVKGATLAKIALQLDIGECLLLGPGELKSGGFRRESTLADALEAIIGAIYLDNGMDAAQQFIRTHFADRLSQLNVDGVLKDPKTRLQEYLQARKSELPVYEIASAEGKDHQQTFHIQCVVKELNKMVVGTGGSRRKAEQQAAEKALELLRKNDKKSDKK
jgi:ribonuclease-3